MFSFVGGEMFLLDNLVSFRNSLSLMVG